MTRILVAYDHSPGSRAALHQAVELFRGAELCLVKGLLEPTSDAPRDTPTLDELVASTERELARVAREAGYTGSVTTRVLVGDAADMILGAAAELKPDVLVVGTHHRGPVARLILGSVTERVLHRAAMPVLVVRAHPDHA